MAFEFSPHIAVQVQDYSKAVDFYQRVLGMEHKRTMKGETELKCGPVTFYIEDNPAMQLFLEFKVDDVEGARAALEAAGCVMMPTQTPEGSRSYLVRDPFGMCFHIFQQG